MKVATDKARWEKDFFQCAKYWLDCRLKQMNGCREVGLQIGEVDWWAEMTVIVRREKCHKR